jgi:hypothetical protein
MPIVQRILAAIIGLAALALAFVFASVVLAVMVAAGVLAGTWLWWRARSQPRARPPVGGQVIEGEFHEVPPSPPPKLERDKP